MYTNMMLAAVCLLTTFNFVVSTADICQSVDKCDCFNSLEEIHCPDKYTPLSVIALRHTEDRQEVLTVDCNTGANSWKVYDFPKIQTTTPNKIVLNSCPMGSDGLRNLGIIKTQALYIINTSTRNVTLKNEYFIETNTIKTLWLQRNDIRNVEQNAFQGFFNLEELNLKENFIRDLDNCLIHTPNLIVLDLAGNALSKLNNNIFNATKNLQTLNLGSNKLTYLAENVFEPLINLKHIDLSNNDLQILSSDNFIFNQNLESLDLSFNLFFTLPLGLFSTLTRLNLFKMRNGQVDHLPVDLFTNCSSLAFLDLSSNKFRQLNGVLANLTALKSLDLSGNALVKVNDEFKSLENLVEINLSNNGISLIAQDAFVRNSKLVYVDLSWNALVDETLAGRFNACLNIEEILLSNNYLENLPLDERHKKLKYVDATSNEFKSLNFNVFTPDAILDFSDNPGILECSCKTYNMFINNLTVISNFHCTNPKWIEDTVNFQAEIFSCVLTQPEICPGNCTCVKRPFDNTIAIDCSYSNLKEYPVIPNLSSEKFEELEVRLEGNFLTEGPQPGLGYEAVTKLYLNHNLITDINWTPPKIKMLSLHDNQLVYINNIILNKFTAKDDTNSISLHNNPWACECSNLALSKFIKDTTKLKSVNITCRGSNVLLANVDQLILCQTFALEVILAVFVAALLVALLVKLFKSKKPREEVKKFDVFISYSHIDEEYVLKTLVPFLEENCNLKTCVHLRDWTVGEFIHKQIVNSIVHSHYTLVVLSKGFFESVWAKTELRLAHLNNAQMIIISKECPKVEDWPMELSAYLKNKLLIQTDDLMFWQKLKNSFNVRIDIV